VKKVFLLAFSLLLLGCVGSSEVLHRPAELISISSTEKIAVKIAGDGSRVGSGYILSSVVRSVLLKRFITVSLLVSAHDPILVGRGGISDCIPEERFEIPVTDMRQEADGIMVVLAQGERSVHLGGCISLRGDLRLSRGGTGGVSPLRESPGAVPQSRRILAMVADLRRWPDQTYPATQTPVSLSYLPEDLQSAPT